ncbi:MAG: 23S rRNA (pseudouridine(1915)-N(3))-methyltransferase RlmH [Clostridia bacterium]|nr:23S rRNA (pseudouridine(1915)-N(3))-methyltransferase RlmH [Clostridia bacterium]
MQIKLIFVGEASSVYKNAIAEYEKRLEPFCSFESVCIKESRLDDRAGANAAEIKKALEKEADAIRAHIPAGAYKAAMCIEGRPFSSEEFSLLFEKISLNGKSKAAFIIGSSHGLDEKLKNECDLRLSMSRMTFPHQLARLMLTEQIYRAFSITSGIKYHK